MLKQCEIHEGTLNYYTKWKNITTKDNRVRSFIEIVSTMLGDKGQWAGQLGQA